MAHLGIETQQVIINDFYQESNQSERQKLMGDRIKTIAANTFSLKCECTTRKSLRI
jgi:hypothetical protein